MEKTECRVSVTQIREAIARGFANPGVVPGYDETAAGALSAVREVEQLLLQVEALDELTQEAQKLGLGY